MLDEYNRGGFEGRGAKGRSNDWRRGDGTPMGYESFLTDNYYTLMAVPLRQSKTRWVDGFRPETYLTCHENPSIFCPERDCAMKILRRNLAKGLAAAGSAGLLQTESLTAATPESSVTWKRIYPGVWKATIGTPERFTPVHCCNHERLSTWPKSRRCALMPRPPADVDPTERRPFYGQVDWT